MNKIYEYKEVKRKLIEFCIQNKELFIFDKTYTMPLKYMELDHDETIVPNFIHEQFKISLEDSKKHNANKIHLSIIFCYHNLPIILIANKNGTNVCSFAISEEDPLTHIKLESILPNEKICIVCDEKIEDDIIRCKFCGVCMCYNCFQELCFINSLWKEDKNLNNRIVEITCPSCRKRFSLHPPHLVNQIFDNMINSLKLFSKNKIYDLTIQYGNDKNDKKIKIQHLKNKDFLVNLNNNDND